jgi:hypothetical protein
MKPRGNPLAWIGLAVTVLAILSYFLLFLRFPVTRDFPWATFILFVPALALLVLGVKRAFQQPQRYRGRISSPILSTVSISLMGLFCYFIFVLAKDLPSPSLAVRTGQRAPEFTLADAAGKLVSLSEILKKNRAAVLIFYRGYW